MQRKNDLPKSNLLQAFVRNLIIVISLIFFQKTLIQSFAFSAEIALPQNQQHSLKPSYIDIRAELTTSTKVTFPGQQITYTFTFKNIGTDEANNLLIRFYAPNELLGGEFHGNFTRFKNRDLETSKVKFDSISVVSGGSNLLKTITWHVDKFALLDSQAIRFTLTVDSLKVSKSLIGIMTLSCAPNFFNQYSSDVKLELLPKLTISKSLYPRGTYSPGDTGVYTIAFSNNGGRDIDSVIVADLLPPGLIIKNISRAPVDTLNRNFIWLIDTLRAGSQGAIKISFQVDPKFKVTSPNSTILNHAAIESGPYNDEASVSFNVIASDIDARIEALPEYYSPGYPITLQAQVKNIGVSPIEDTFKVAFYLGKITAANRIGHDIFIYSLKEDAKEITQVSTIWDNPPEGDHLILVYADYANEIIEVEEIKNNIDSTVAKVQVSEVHLVTNELISFDPSVRNRTPAFPDNLFVYLSVLDQHDHPVHKLAHSIDWLAESGVTELNVPAKDIWSLAEENQPVASFSAAEIRSDQGFPISVTIVAPLTKSNVLASIKTEVCNFINRFSTVKDKFAGVAFSNHLLNVIPFSNNFDAICSLVRGESNDPPTALFDAIYRGVAETAKQPGRRAVIVLTNGSQNCFIQLQKVIEYANRLGVPIFVLSYGAPNQQNLQDLAHRCGGLYYEVRQENISATLQQLYEMLNNYYIFSYGSPNSDQDGAWRTLDVTLKYPNYLQAIGQNSQGIYLAPTDSHKVWMDIASFPSGLTKNCYEQLWKLTKPQENYEYVITCSNIGNEKLDRVSLNNWKSSFVTLANPVDADFSIDRGQNYVINFMATVNSQLPQEWLPIIDSAKVSLNQGAMAAAVDTVWLIQDLKPVIRESRPDEPFPIAYAPITITLLDSITIWAGWTRWLIDFKVTLLPPMAAPIDYTQYIKNMPSFPVGPDTMAFIDNYRPPKKFTEDEIEKWDVRLDYQDLLGEAGTVTTSFFIEARNDLVLDRNVSRRGEPVSGTIFIAKENRVTIDIYNEIGEHVRQLVNSYYQKDSNATTIGEPITWNCNSSDGRLVGSGIYIFVMQAGGYKTFKKVVVIH